MKQFVEQLQVDYGWLGSLDFALVALAVMLTAAAVILGVVAFIAGFSSYIERRVAAFIQSRLGPNRVGPQGLFQFIADGLKIFQKEDIIPDKADRSLFRFAPYLVFMGSFAVFVAFPYSDKWIVGGFNLGVLYLLAISSLAVIGILMSGWASGNKWSLLGGMRSAAQIVSYEIPIGLTFLTMVMIAGTLSTAELVEQQKDGLFSWFVFRYPPFTIIAMLAYFVAGVAETNRTPFDIPEAESELVAGYHTEYSGLRFAFFFIAEYANMLAVGLIVSILFLGGWVPPYGDFLLPGFWGKLEGVFWLLGKAYFWVLIMMWMRFTLPRYRVDQLMNLAWKILLPLAFLNLAAIGYLCVETSDGVRWVVEAAASLVVIVFILGFAVSAVAASRRAARRPSGQGSAGA